MIRGQSSYNSHCDNREKQSGTACKRLRAAISSALIAAGLATPPACCLRETNANGAPATPLYFKIVRMRSELQATFTRMRTYVVQTVERDGGPPYSISSGAGCRSQHCGLPSATAWISTCSVPDSSTWIRPASSATPTRHWLPTPASNYYHSNKRCSNRAATRGKTDRLP